MSSATSPQIVPSFPTLRQLRPFFWVALGWAILALVLSLPAGGDLRAVGWTALVTALSLGDLFALAKVCQLLLLGGSVPAGADRSPYYFQVFFWGFIKLACLALLAVVLWASREAPHRSLLLGLGTFIIVPLLGGFLWSSKELGHARRT